MFIYFLETVTDLVNDVILNTTVLRETCNEKRKNSIIWCFLKHFSISRHLCGWMWSCCLTPDASFGFGWSTSGPQSVKGANTEVHSGFTERGEKQQLLLGDSCGLERDRSQKGDRFWLETHTHSQEPTQIWTTQNQQQHHYLMTPREAVRTGFTQKPHIWDCISPQLAASHSWEANIIKEASGKIKKSDRNYFKMTRFREMMWPLEEGGLLAHLWHYKSKMELMKNRWEVCRNRLLRRCSFKKADSIFVAFTATTRL